MVHYNYIGWYGTIPNLEWKEWKCFPVGAPAKNYKNICSYHKKQREKRETRYSIKAVRGESGRKFN